MLLNLPLEILDHLFGYFKEKDKLRLAQVNEQLGCAFAHHSRMRYQKLVCLSYTADELRVITTFCGSNITSISVVSPSVPAIIGELLAKYCINLEDGYFFVTPTNFNAVKSIVNLKSLRSICLDTMESLPSDLLQYVNPYCKSLTIHTWMGEEQHIRQLIHLEALRVSSPKGNIFEICSNLKKLRILRLYNLSYKQEETRYSYGELEDLDLMGIKIQLDLPTCPKLKKLRLLFIDFKNDNIGDIIAKYANTLEHLVITPEDRTEQFYAENLIIVLRKCKRLLFIKTTLQIINVLFTKYLETFIQVIKENGFNTQNRFILEINNPPLKKGRNKKELMEKYPNSELWSLITLND